MLNEFEEEVVEVEDESETETITEKKIETPEAKKARLERQLAQVNKKLGVSIEKEEEKKPDNSNTLLEKAFLRSAGIVDKEEVAEALKTAEKWGMTVDELVDDEDWNTKLEKLRIRKSNALATSGVKGDKSGGTSTKNTPEYWIAKGTPPSAEDVPDRETRTKITKAMMANAKNGKKFYND